MQRLDKLLSEAGVASRKELKTIIRAGRVTVDGQVVKSPEQKVDEQSADVRVDGQPVGKQRTILLMLHKPAGFVTSTDEPRDRTVMELIPQEYRYLDPKPVGRLDKETEGLLLFTNDGDLLHRLISPKKEVPKVYYARHEGQATQDDVAAFAEGLRLRDGTCCLSAQLEPLGAGESLITVCEGMVLAEEHVGGCFEQLVVIQTVALQVAFHVAAGGSLQVCQNTHIGAEIGDIVDDFKGTGFLEGKVEVHAELFHEHHERFRNEVVVLGGNRKIPDALLVFALIPVGDNLVLGKKLTGIADEFGAVLGDAHTFVGAVENADVELVLKLSHRGGKACLRYEQTLRRLIHGSGTGDCEDVFTLLDCHLDSPVFCKFYGYYNTP